MIDFADLAKKAAIAARDAHQGELPAAGLAYSFMLDNPEFFGVEEWPQDMPSEPTQEFVTAYYEDSGVTMLGTARNTAAAQQWLNSCDAVETWFETQNCIVFVYDPAVEVTVVPDFISFEAPARSLFYICEDSGARVYRLAEGVDEAVAMARKWVADGDYEERGMATAYVGEWVDGEFQNHTSVEVEVGLEPKPPVTECGSGDDAHDWQTPLALVGGCRENPGVRSVGGTALEFDYVCAGCGVQKHVLRRGEQRNAGELPVEVSYQPADSATLAWVESQR